MRLLFLLVPLYLLEEMEEVVIALFGVLEKREVTDSWLQQQS